METGLSLVVCGVSQVATMSCSAADIRAIKTTLSTASIYTHMTVYTHIRLSSISVKFNVLCRVAFFSGGNC